MWQFCKKSSLSYGQTLPYFQFQAHPWFRGVNWDTLYEMEAAYKPTVSGELDTQNFEKFDEVCSLELEFERMVIEIAQRFS